MKKAASPLQTRQLTLVLFSLLLTFLWCGTAYRALSHRAQVLADNERFLGQLTVAVEEQTVRLFKLMETSMIAASQWIEAHPGQEPVSSAEFIRLITGLRGTADGLIDLRLIDGDGLLCEVPCNEAVPRDSVAGHEYFRIQLDEHRRGFYIGAPLVSPSTGSWSIPVSYPVQLPGSRIIAVLGVLSLDRLDPLHEAQRIRPNGTIALLRTDGTILARAPVDHQLLGRSVASSSGYRDHLQTEVRGIYLTDSRVTDGVPKYVSFVRLKDYPLLVVISSAVEDVLWPWKRETLLMVAAMVLLTLGAFLLLMQLMRSLRANESIQAELAQLAANDSLTGLPNRRSFFQSGQKEMARARRYGKPLSLLMVDVDFFKQVNDNYGHAVGDEALRVVARQLRESLRSIDLPSRVGGEEFGVLLPESNLSASAEVAERLRLMIADETVACGSGGIRVTVSIGVAGMDPADTALDQLLARADAAMYRAKRDGRNRVEVEPGVMQ